ncbi:hypothetical protein AX15_006162 [Amanita polypyramis BW_CC]|nr:hypothetical protein AX15_006162 [Amanita polypyramis BW_CC]
MTSVPNDLSSISNEAIRLLINILLRDSRRRGTRLFNFYAMLKVVERSLIVAFDSRLNWTILTFFSLILFTAQTSAWTTLFTPRLVPMNNSVKFYDANFSKPTYAGDAISLDPSKDQIELLISGYDAARRSLGLPASFAHRNSEFNGSTWGILPLPNFYPDSYSEWSSVEALQQGSTADVTCSPIPRGDTAIQLARQTSTISGSSIIQTYLCCNCTSNDTSGQGYDYIFYDFPDANHPTQSTLFIVSTVCPYVTNASGQGITVYTVSSSSTYSKTCTIKPRLLDVSVTYSLTSVDSGMVVIKPRSKGSNLDFNTTIVSRFVQDLESSFFFAQSATGNEIISVLDETAYEFGSTSSTNEYDNVVNKLMENFIRGIFEFSLTGTREALGQTYANELNNTALFYEDNSTKALDVVVWGHIPDVRIPVILVPLIIMVLNIAFLAYVFIKCQGIIRAGRWDDLKHIMYFNPMDFLHVLAACKSSNMAGLAFPSHAQGDNGKYFEKVDIELH